MAVSRRRIRHSLGASIAVLATVAATSAGSASIAADSTAVGSSTPAAPAGTTVAASTPAGGSTAGAPAFEDPMTNFKAEAGMSPIDCKPKDGGPLKAAWIYVGPINDGGWTTAHDNGRKEVQEALGDKIVTTYKENIPEGPQVSQTIDQLVKDGNTLIFGTSFGFQDAFVESAAKYPNVCFDFATGYKISSNMGQFYGAGEDTDYLTGMAAGAATKNGKIGYVAPFPIPEVIRGVNAYTLGARAVNPNATVQVVWTNTWFDPAKERAAAESLIANGVDVIGAAQDSPASGEAAKAAGLPWSGYDADQSENFPDNWLTATTYHWGAYETARARQALEGTWVAGNYYGNLRDGFVRLANYGKLVTEETRAKIEARKAELAAKPGSEFTGPIKDQKGEVRIAEGAQATFDELMSMNYLVEGVVGELPAG